MTTTEYQSFRAHVARVLNRPDRDLNVFRPRDDGPVTLIEVWEPAREQGRGLEAAEIAALMSAGIWPTAEGWAPSERSGPRQACTGVR